MADHDVIDERIRTTLRDHIGTREERLVDDPAAVVRARVGTRRRRRRAAIVAAMAVCIVGATAAVIAVADADDQDVDTISPPTEETTSASSEPTQPEQNLPWRNPFDYLRQPPLTPRRGPAMVWTGSKLVAWGGSSPDAPGQGFTDGAAYDATTDSWLPMSASPLPGGEMEAVGVMTTAGVVLARGNRVARWDPAADTWELLDDAPGPIVDLASDGTLVVSASANAVLDVRDGHWRPLARPPVVLERPTTAWTGEELVVVGGPSTPFTSAVALAVRPSEHAWRRLADPPDQLHAEALSADWDGERVVVVNYDMQAVAYDPQADRWERLPDSPARFSENIPTFVSPGGGTGVAFHSQAAVVRTATGDWIPLPRDLLPEGRTTSISGTGGTGRILIWTLDTSGSNHRPLNRPYALDPVRFAESSPVLQVGVARIGAPVRTLVDSSYVGDIGQEVVKVVTKTESGSDCTVTSAYFGAIDDPPLPISESLDNGMPLPTEWRHSRDGTRWQTRGTETDTVTIACDDAAAARDIATGTRFD